MNEERLSMLVERYLDREASADEMAELQAQVRQDAEARKHFWEAAEWHALFRQWGEQEWGQQAARAERRAVPVAVRPAARSVGRPRASAAGGGKIVRFPFGRWAVGIAAAAAAVVLFFMLQSPAPVATLDRVAGAAWTSKKFASGARLKPGRLQIEKGAVVIAFDRGARVVLEGPADFELRDGNSSVLHAGRLRAHVPPTAHGFKVETPQFTAVDIGTEFGCDLGLNGVGELHVFAGKVDLHTGDARSAAVRLIEKEAMRIEDGVASRRAAQPDSFLSENELRRRALRDKGDALGSWRIASRQLAENPATFLHLDFEKLSGAMVPNRALQAGPSSNARIIGCKPVAGRWPGKGALSFQGAEDRLQLALPGQFPSLTLLAWVRVKSLHAKRNSLFMGHGSPVGDLNWYLYGNGELGLGARTNTNGVQSDWRNIHSLPVVGPQNIGSWIFVASVLDGATGTATHYLNGAPIAPGTPFVRIPLQFKMVAVGNDPPRESSKPGDPPPNFDGSIDEFALLSTALTAEEITRLYTHGKP